MKYLAVVLALLIVTGCSFAVKDTRSPEVAAATQTARAEANILPTVTPNPPAPTLEPEVLPTEEVGETTPVPPEALIKGNISSSGEKIYHVPGQANYNNVKIDESKGEAWFVTEEEAQAAGFRKALR